MNDVSKLDARVQESIQAYNAPPQQAKAEEAQQAAQQFEAIFLRMIVKDMRKSATSMTGSGMMGEGVGADVREGWFDSFMGDHLAASGRVGLADALYRDWVEAGKVAPEDEAATEAEVASVSTSIRDADNQFADLIQGLGNLNGKGGL